MITLTTPTAVRTTLGGAATVNYDKLVLDGIVLSPIDGSISAQVIISASSDSNQTPIRGTLQITTAGTPFLIITVPQLNFVKRLQIVNVNAVTALIANAQNAIESGLITLAVAAGVQSAGV